MKKPAKFVTKICPHCKGPNTVVNYRYLAYRRALAGVSLRELAKRGRISAPTLCLFEQGTYLKGPTPRILRVYDRIVP